MGKCKKCGGQVKKPVTGGITVPLLQDSKDNYASVYFSKSLTINKTSYRSGEIAYLSFSFIEAILRIFPDAIAIIDDKQDAFNAFIENRK